MKVLFNRPLIFIDTPEVDEVSVEFRRVHKMLQGTMEITHSEFSSLQDLIEDDSSITYGIVKAGEPDPDGVPIVKVENIRKDRTIDVEGLSRVSPSISNAYSRTILQPRDILISIKGTIGRIAEVPDELDSGNITRDSALIRLKDKNTNDFIMLYLESELAQLQMTLHSRGAAVKGINLSDLREVKVPVIERIDQKQIIERYNELRIFSQKVEAKAISVESQRQQMLDSIVELIAQEIGLPSFPAPWFGKMYIQSAEAGVDRIDVLGANTDFEKMCETSGKFGQLGDVCEIDGTNQQIPIGLQRYISIEELPGNFWGNIEIPEVEVEEQTGRTHFLPGDIAWAHLKPSILQGKAFVINEECWGSHHFLRLSTSDVDENMRTIIWAYLKTGPIKRHLANKCTGKSESQKDVNDRALAQLPFPVLNQDQARRIAEGIREKIRQSHELERIEGDYRNRASYLLNKAKANISNLLDDRWFNRLVDEAKEALQ